MSVIEQTVTDDEATAADEGPTLTKRRRRLPILRALAAVWIGTVLLLSILAPVLPLPDPLVAKGMYFQRPGGSLSLGADQLGRDILSRLIWGGRTSFEVVLLVTAFSMVIGVTLGMVAGYFRGWLDWAISGAMDLVLAFPGLLLLIVLTSLRGRSLGNLVLGLCIIGTPTYVRLARANTLTWAQREFVLSARGLGAKHWRVMIRHVLPNIVPTILAYALTAAGLIFVIEGSLSFLGLGIPAPQPSWGSMIAGGRARVSDVPHIVVIPSIVISLTVLSFNLLGDRRDKSARTRRA